MDDNRSGGVGRYLDEARVGREHLKLLGLVGGGGFFDGFDIYLAGSVLATMVATKFSTVGQNATFDNLCRSAGRVAPRRPAWRSFRTPHYLPVRAALVRGGDHRHRVRSHSW